MALAALGLGLLILSPRPPQRAIATASGSVCCQISSFIASYLNPVALEAIGWRYYIAQWVFNGVVIVVIYVETSGLTLEEIAAIFDGEDQFLTAFTINSAGLAKESEVETSHEEETKATEFV
jgi:hypothetical protein